MCLRKSKTTPNLKVRFWRKLHPMWKYIAKTWPNVKTYIPLKVHCNWAKLINIHTHIYVHRGKWFSSILLLIPQTDLSEDCTQFGYYIEHMVHSPLQLCFLVGNHYLACSSVVLWDSLPWLPIPLMLWVSLFNKRAAITFFSHPHDSDEGKVLLIKFTCRLIKEWYMSK